jgi:hypothetical protein
MCAGLVVFMPRRQNKTGTNLLSEGGNFTTQKASLPNSAAAAPWPLCCMMAIACLY